MNMHPASGLLPPLSQLAMLPGVEVVEEPYYDSLLFARIEDTNVQRRHGSPDPDAEAHVSCIRGELILEIGCGSGGITTFVEAAFPNAQVTAIDKSQLAVQEARRKVVRAEVECRDILDLEDDRRFDTIILGDCTVNSFSPDEGRKLFSKIPTLMTPGGVFSVSLFHEHTTPLFELMDRTVCFSSFVDARGDTRVATWAFRFDLGSRTLSRSVAVLDHPPDPSCRVITATLDEHIWTPQELIELAVSSGLSRQASSEYTNLATGGPSSGARMVVLRFEIA